MPEKEKFTYGYDPFTHMYCVGVATEQGTIKEVVEWSPTVEEAKDLAKQLNQEGPQA